MPAVPGFVARGNGTIINIASIVALAPEILNGVYGGTTPCQDDGTYSILVDLFAGQNVIVARVADALGQYGPDSQTINIFYNAPALALPSGSAGTFAAGS